MQFFRSLKGKILIILSICVLSISFLAFSPEDNLFELNKNLDIFATLFKELNVYYVDETNPEKLTQKAMDSMLESLDPYTEYYPESSLEEYKMHYVSTEYGGIGALIQNHDGKILISEPYEGFPAQKADLRAGDMILSIDGKAVNANPVSEVSEMLKGAAGSQLKLIVKRGEEKPFEKQFVREVIKFGNVTYCGLAKSDIGYIKLDKFLTDASKEFKEKIESLQLKKLSGLIIDLRGNGGGILQEAVQIVNLFVPKGEEIVKQKGKMPEMNSNYRTNNLPLDLEIPICVLVDTSTASASEITAGALQDLDRAVVIGQRTYGKGLVQQTKQLSYNAQIKITVAKYYIPSGRCVQAINYAKKNKKGKADYVPDSLINEYKTKGGRLVYDGSGIAPDIKTDIKPYSSILFNLVTKNLIFNFASKYRNSKNTIPAAKLFKLSDSEYKDFADYVISQKFTYNTVTETKLEEFKKMSIEEKYYLNINDEFKNLENKIKHNLEQDLIRFKPEIKEILENEIVSRYYFQNGRIENLFDSDKDVQKAIDIIKDKPLYTSILKGEGIYGAIGKPKWKK